MYSQSLLHYTFSKPEATFNFIKKLVKNNLALSPGFSICVYAFSPLHAPSFLCPLSFSALGFSLNRKNEPSITQCSVVGAHLFANLSLRALVERSAAEAQKEPDVSVWPGGCPAVGSPPTPGWGG